MIFDKKTIIIIALCISLLIVGYIAYKPKQINIYESVMKAEIQRLTKLNQKTIQLISERDLKINKFAIQIDSLEHLKPKIHIQYVSKYKEINDANANSVADEFKRIFANANIN